MNPGAVFFDTKFHFHDGQNGEKLFVILGSLDGISVISKTTSRPNGRGIQFGCQQNDRFHNFYLPNKSCSFKTCTWICLDEFYEFTAKDIMLKQIDQTARHLFNFDENFTMLMQQCALESLDLSSLQEKIITDSIV